MTDTTASTTMFHRARAILARPSTIIAVLLLPKFPIAYSALAASPPRYDIGGGIAAEIVVLLGLSYFVIKGNRIASWVMAIALWLQALLSCLVPFMPRTIPLGLRALSLSLGIYYIAGGLVLVKRHGSRQPNKAL